MKLIITQNNQKKYWNIKQLEKIDTNDVPCTTRAIEVINVFRKDEKKNYDCTEDILDLGPSREDEFFKVPKITTE